MFFFRKSIPITILWDFISGPDTDHEYMANTRGTEQKLSCTSGPARYWLWISRTRPQRQYSDRYSGHRTDNGNRRRKSTGSRAQLRR